MPAKTPVSLIATTSNRASLMIHLIHSYKYNSAQRSRQRNTSPNGERVRQHFPSAKPMVRGFIYSFKIPLIAILCVSYIWSGVLRWFDRLPIDNSANFGTDSVKSCWLPSDHEKPGERCHLLPQLMRHNISVLCICSPRTFELVHTEVTVSKKTLNTSCIRLQHYTLIIHYKYIRVCGYIEVW